MSQDQRQRVARGNALVSKSNVSVANTAAYYLDYHFVRGEFSRNRFGPVELAFGNQPQPLARGGAFLRGQGCRHRKPPHPQFERSKTLCQGTLVWGIEGVIAITSACDLMAGEPAPGDVLAVLVFHVRGRIPDCIPL